MPEQEPSLAAQGSEPPDIRQLLLDRLRASLPSHVTDEQFAALVAVADEYADRLREARRDHS